MKEISVSQLTDNMFDAIGKEWMLVTAGTPDHFNMMTASWGGVGILWGKPVAFVFIRPERYTHEYIEQSSHLTLSFLGEENRSILNFCGTKSGRDVNKVEATGLRPLTTPGSQVTYEQARLTLECRKLYKTHMQPDEFIDKSNLEKWYGERGGLHDVYVVEIEHVYVR